MAMDFPNSPTLNQVYTVGSAQWKYNGSYWESIITGGRLIYANQAKATATVNPNSTSYIACTGATLSPTTQNDDIVVINATWDLQCDGNGTSAVGTLFINGTGITSPLCVLANVNPGTATSGVRATLSQTYVGTVGTTTNFTAGTLAYDLRVRCGAGFTSNVTCRTDHTQITVQVFR